VTHSPHFQIEEALLQQGYTLLGGADEAGRGSLFGPVCVGIAVLPLANTVTLAKTLNGVRDSKQLPRPRVYELAEMVKAMALTWGAGEASAREIDERGIVGGVEIAFFRAYEQLQLPQPLDYLIADARMPLTKLKIPHMTYVKGDATSYSIACGAILAKTLHDQRVRELAADLDPAYGLLDNVGYGTAAHLAAIRQLGATPHHRHSYRPIAQPRLFD
jgi:ribonuclease HII